MQDWEMQFVLFPLFSQYWCVQGDSEVLEYMGKQSKDPCTQPLQKGTQYSRHNKQHKTLECDMFYGRIKDTKQGKQDQGYRKLSF